MELLLLDLDGTVRESKSGAKFINKPDDQKLIDGVEDAIARYPDIPIVGITNQGGVKAGFKTIEDAIAEQKITLSLLPQMSMIYFCPDDGQTVYRVVKDGFDVNRTGWHPQSSVHRKIWSKVAGRLRKPGEGMLLLAIDWYETSANNCLYVGDRPEDEVAAIAADIPFSWADAWRRRS